MHIVFMTTNFVDNDGPTMGLPKYLLRVSKALIGYGHKVSVVTCSNRTVAYEYLGINVYRVRRPKIRLHNEQKKDAIASGLRDGYILAECLAKIYSREKVDIVQYTSLSGLSYFHNLPIPAVMRLSSYAKMVNIEGLELNRIGAAMLEREASKKCDAIFAPSIETAKCFENDINRKVDVIETPFVLEDDNEDDSIYINKFEGKDYVLFYGTIIKYKGITVIADMVYELLDKYKSLYIGIIGNGDNRLIEYLYDQAKEHSNRVIYNEGLGFSQLMPIIKNAKAVLLPSITENFSNACVETMALGQIVIGTRGASFDQLITDGENGYLCEIGDGRTLLEAIEKALQMTPNEISNMSFKAKERIAELAPEKVVNQLLDYYTKVINDYDKKERLCKE